MRWEYLTIFLIRELILFLPWDKELAAAAAKLLQSCPTLCHPIDGSPPGFPVPGILQARTLEWVVISFSNAWKWKVKVKPPSYVRLLVTPWTAAYQAPLSMGFFRQEYWSGLPCPPSGDLSDPGIEPRSPTLQADALTSEPPGKPELTYFSLILRTAQMCPRVFRFVFVSFDEPRYCLK